MSKQWMVVTVVAGMALPGCGEIIEVPVAMTSETGRTDDDTSGSEPAEGPSSSTGTDPTDPTGHDTQTPDIDDASTSAPADDTASSTGGRPLESIPFCLELEDAFEIPEDGSWGEGAVEVELPSGVVSLGISLRITHPRVSDLHVRMRSPGGSTIDLLRNPECSGANIDAMFVDDAGQLGNEQCLADTTAIMGSVKALDEVSPLVSEAVAGTWTLELMDTEPEEVGSLDGVCVVLFVEGG